MLSQLNLFNFAVIYLALGAPLGVYHLATNWGGSIFSTFSFAAVNVCLWPAAAFVYAYSHLKGRYRPGTDGIESGAEALLDSATKVLTTDELFAFRETVARYVGICEALESPIGTSGIEGFLDITGQNATAAAIACSVRRNRAKLDLHQADARREFVTQITALAFRDDQIFKLGRGLAISLRDHVAANEINDYPNPATSDIHISSDRISLAA